MPPPRQEESDRLLEEAQRLYLRHGITTVQDGLTKEEEWTLLSSAAQRAKLLVDTVCYPAMKECAHLVTEHPEYQSYRGRLRIGGYKIILDGSPQGRTAWLSQPYEGEQDGYRGYPALTDAEAEGYIRRAVEEGAQLLAHCNGDAAAEQLIGLMEKAVAGGMTPRRPVMIHAQTVRRDQLSRMAALQMIPSFLLPISIIGAISMSKIWGWRGPDGSAPPVPPGRPGCAIPSIRTVRWCLRTCR